MRNLIVTKEPNTNPKLQAFPYQQQAVKSVCDLEYAAVFHEQGLGKTKIAIDIMLHWLEHKYVDTVLLIVKKGLVSNWLRELRLHSFVVPRILTQNSRNNYSVFNSPARLVLGHYEVFKSEKKRLQLFLKTRSVAIILDESTKIKNPEADLTKVFFELATLFKKRIIMTGLPVANRPYDIWSQIFFLDAGRSLGNVFSDFKRQADFSCIEEGDCSAANFEKFIASIREKINFFSVRETKRSGIIQLPDKKIENIVTDWEPQQRELYSRVKEELKAVVIKEGLLTEDNSEVVLKRMLRLVQIASNPRLVDHSYGAEPGKFSVLYDLVARVCREGEKCIVWSSFTENIDNLAQFLMPFGVEKVHGKLSMGQRDSTIKNFLNNSDVRVLVASPGTAKEGLTLTVANHAIFFDRSFSLDDYLQSQDRIHRISQKKTCYVFNLIMKDSIDEWVDALLKAKELAAQLAQGDISLEYYKGQISYSFLDIIKEIIGGAE